MSQTKPSRRLAALTLLALLCLGTQAHADAVNREQAVIVGTRLETGAALGAALEGQAVTARLERLPPDSSFRIAGVPDIELWAARSDRARVIIAVCRGSGSDDQLKAAASFAGATAGAVFAHAPDRILFAHRSLPLTRLGDLGRTLHPGDAVFFRELR
jgi:hypothetical protein